MRASTTLLGCGSVFSALLLAAIYVAPNFRVAPTHAMYSPREREPVDHQAFTDVARRNAYESLADQYLSSITVKYLRPDVISAALAGDLASSCILVEFKNGKSNITRKFEPPGKHGRLPSAIALVEAAQERFGTAIPDCTFLIMLTDGMRPSIPLLGSAKMYRTWNNFIPIPTGNERGLPYGYGTSFTGWNQYMERFATSLHAKYPWNSKTEKAVFRGNFAMQPTALGSCPLDCRDPKSWREVNRGKLFSVAEARPDLFDVEFIRKGSPQYGDISDVPVDPGAKIEFSEHMQYKYLLNVGAQFDWAERLKNFLFMNSVVIKHEAELLEWYFPLLKPFQHYIPTDILMSDLVEMVTWAKRNDDKVVRIVKNANAFAKEHLCEDSLVEFFYVLLTKYARLQSQQVKL
mmetsp:Transcript_6127/g.14899  ORF Transcript_6127/g.14899 Transcript_6127/m.14899 type:complete len:405 (+) Transcript_6127:178-1392(+)